MGPPDYDPAQLARFRFQRGQITDATFIGPTLVIDHQDISGVTRFHRFAKNIHTSKMLCRKSAAGEAAAGDDRLNPKRRDADRNAKSQRGISNQRSGKLGKLFDQRAVVQCCDSLSKIDN
jgi:hypothetical protein